MKSKYSHREILLFMLLAAVVAGHAVSSHAQTLPGRPDVDVAYTYDKPLMVIRFNQRKVYYEKSLYNTVSKAVVVKPTVMFDVVAVSPVLGDSSEQQSFADATANAGNRVMKTLRDIGVPQSRMSYSQITDANIEFPEVRLFVR